MKYILHITHPWGGGIATYIDDLRRASGDAYGIVTMKSWQGMVNVAQELDGQYVEKEYCLGEDLGLTDYTNDKYSKLLNWIIDKYGISIVHIDSQVGHTFDVFHVPKSKNIPLICTVHDYFYICPTFHLVDKNGDFCGICKKGEENHACLSHHAYLYSKFNGNDLGKFREVFSSLLNNVDVYVFPSVAAKALFTGFYRIEDERCRVIYHGTFIQKNMHTLPSRHGRNLRVGILGSMLKHKGMDSISSIIKELKEYPIDFYHFGDGDLTGANLSRMGRYDRDKIVSMLQSKQIDVILLLSTWPETFSYTLTESIAANVPVIVSDMGALAERVAEHDIGWLVDYRDIDGICDLLLRLSRDEGEIEQYKRRVCNVSLKTAFDMNQEYDELYDDLISNDKYNNNQALGNANIKNEPDEIAAGFMGGMVQLTMMKARLGIYRAKNKIINYITKA